MKADYSLDIRQDSCPLTFVKTKLLLEQMQPGQKAQLLLSEGEAVASLPVAIKEQGSEVVTFIKQEDGSYELMLQKG